MAGRDDMMVIMILHILATVNSIGLKFGMLMDLILTFNATKHFFMLYKNKTINVVIHNVSFQYINIEKEQKFLNLGCLIKYD